jgi:hypothetical protein
MTTYREVSQALVSAGYLSEADIEAAAALLAAELIDEANLEVVTSLIADTWVTTEGDEER